MRPLSFSNASISKILPILKMPPNFWPVSLWNRKCRIFCTSTNHNICIFKTTNPKKSTEWKSKKSLEYIPIHGIHLDIDKVTLVNLAILVKCCMVLSCISTNPEWLMWEWYWVKWKWLTGPVVDHNGVKSSCWSQWRSKSVDQRHVWLTINWYSKGKYGI